MKKDYELQPNNKFVFILYQGKMILTIVSMFFTMILFVAVVYMGYRMYTFENKITYAFNDLVEQINKVNKIEYKVDLDQQKRIQTLEKK